MFRVQPLILSSTQTLVKAVGPSMRVSVPRRVCNVCKHYLCKYVFVYIQETET